MSTVATRIIDRNGKETTVHRSVTKHVSKQVTAVSAPPLSTTLAVERPITDASSVAADIKSRYPGVTLHFAGSEYSGYATLDMISVPKEMRGQGIASKIMGELIETADKNGWNMALTPSADLGSSKKRLIEFYGRYGFVPNSGRNKDYAISETMLRLVED